MRRPPEDRPDDDDPLIDRMQDSWVSAKQEIGLLLLGIGILVALLQAC